MSYWIKHFVDARNETGKDADLLSGKASWTKGRLDGLRAATLSFAGTIIKVDAMNPGAEIWQKDQFVVGVGSKLPTERIARSLGLKLTKYDVDKCAYVHDEGHQVYSLRIKQNPPGNYMVLSEKDIGSWLILKISRVGTVGLLIGERYRV
jgi:hypothetical protein